MRGMLLAGSATLLGGGAYVSGAFEQGEYYPMETSAVEARLAGLNFGDEATGAQARLVLRSRGPAVVRWDLMMDGERVADVRAHLAPEAPGTRVRVAFAFMKGDALMGLEEDPFLNQIAEIAMTEKVDSTLDGRAFNEGLMQAKMAAAIAANPQGLANMQTTLHQNASEEMRRSVEDDFYGNGYPGKAGKPTASTKPTSSAKPMAPTNFSETHADGGWGNN